MNKYDSTGGQNKKKIIVILAATVAVLLGLIYVAYLQLQKSKNLELKTQEQFSAEPQISDQTQAECQKSAEFFTTTNDITVLFSEYQKSVENCHDVYFALNKKSQFRTEGLYPDLAIDLALLAAQTNMSQALQILNFAKTLPAWGFSMGVAACGSTSVLDAYIESLNIKSEFICYDAVKDQNKLFNIIKTKNFSSLVNTLKQGDVVGIGSPESDVACPEKMATIIKLAHGAGAVNSELFKEPSVNTETNNINFIFKTKNEDELVFVFTPKNNCLQLQSILIPNFQTNE